MILIIFESSISLLLRKFFLAGTLKNKSFTSIIVPFEHPICSSLINLPPSTSINVPKEESKVLVIIFKFEISAIEAKASPRKPKELIDAYMKLGNLL